MAKMNREIDALDPAKKLALAYARPEIREVLAIMLKLDMRLGRVLQQSTEPLIAQMRVAWWRDAFGKPTDQWPKGEPLFQDIKMLSPSFSSGILANAMLNIIEAWGTLLAHEEWTDSVLQDYARYKSAGIFISFATLLGDNFADAESLAKLGMRWAIIDLLQYCGSHEQVENVRSAIPEVVPMLLRPQLKPLSMLALSAEQPSGSLFSGVRLIWHGLTGR
jgi:15-cis-phytoene synthase